MIKWYIFRTRQAFTYLRTFCNVQDVGETALHLAVVRELGHSLHIVDFLVQNMPSQAIDRVTASFNTPGTPAGTPGSGQQSPM